MPKFQPTSYIQPAIKMVVACTTYAVTQAIIKNNTADPETNAQKATLAVGSYVLGQMVAVKSAQFVDAKITTLIAETKQAKADAEAEKAQK